MTATEILRRLLDERGVEYTVVHGYHEYIWEFGEFGIARASAIGTRGLVQMIVTGITPEQAIAATLGSSNCTDDERTETCHVKLHPDLKAYPLVRFCEGVCSECGEELPNGCNYCPNCGRKVVDA